MGNNVRTVEALQRLDLIGLNRRLRELSLQINELQGRIGPVNFEDSISTNDKVGIGDVTLSDVGGLVAEYGGFSNRPVGAWIPGEKDLEDNVAKGLISVSQPFNFSATHGLLTYAVLLHDTSGNRLQAETGLLSYVGGQRPAGTTSSVSAITAMSQVVTAGTLAVSFSTTNLTNSYTISITANTSLPSSTGFMVNFWVWPLIGEIDLL